MSSFDHPSPSLQSTDSPALSSAALSYLFDLFSSEKLCQHMPPSFGLNNLLLRNLLESDILKAKFLHVADAISLQCFHQ
jgi:hypothetical protein